MALYFRGDTRSPDVVFNDGFKNRDYNDYAENYKQDLKKNWSPYNCISPFSYITDGCAIDVRIVTSCVCLTTCFASAGIFPVDNTVDTYIYAISLPNSVPIELETIKHEWTPHKQNMALNQKYVNGVYGSGKNRVFNLHNLQIEQSKELIGKISKFHQIKDVIDIAWPLYGYEAFADNVLGREIICAIKCTDRKRIPGIGFGNKGPQDLCTEFSCFLKPIEYNQSFTKHLSYCAFYLQEDTGSFIDDRKKAASVISESSVKTRVESPNIAWGLAGKTIG
jgi:hypothetical protein